jgi:hypothetical protein
MVIRNSRSGDRRLCGRCSLIVSVGLAFALIHVASCSNSGSTPDGSGDGGGGTGGPSTSGVAGGSGHSAIAGAAGSGSGGAAGNGGVVTSRGPGGGGSGGYSSSAAAGASGGTGSGGAPSDTGSGQPFSCGPETCNAGKSYCFSYVPTAGQPPSLTCQVIWSGCASAPTSCACLCPPASSAALGCVPSGMNEQSNSCTCDSTGGVVNISCKGS